MLPDKYSGLLIGSQYSLKVGLINYFYAFYRLQSTVIYPIIAEAMIEKHCNGNFVCRAHDARSRAADARAVHCKLKARSFFIVGRFKGHVLHCIEVKMLKGRRLTLGISHRKLNGKPHIRNAELRDNGSVNKLDHGVNDALRMHTT